jgi:hypothetical protein
MTRARTFAIVSVIVVVCFILVFLLLMPDGRMASRDIGCAKVPPGRANHICNALSASMHWTWLGHAIISPGWRLNWSDIRQVYCDEKITDADLTILETLKRGADWRLQNGADSLIRIVSGRNEGAEPENSVFNPNNPYYILKNGCV